MSPQVKSVKEDVTLKDIAEVVGKSVAAVSRALNDYDDISEETRAYGLWRRTPRKRRPMSSRLLVKWVMRPIRWPNACANALLTPWASLFRFFLPRILQTLDQLPNPSCFDDGFL